MSAARLRIKTFALESLLGRSVYAAANLLRARMSANAYERTAAYLRAWRATGSDVVTRQARACMRELLAPDGSLRPLKDNPILRAFVTGTYAEGVRREFAGYDIADRVRMRYPRPGEDAARQGNLILLKAPVTQTGEKGVVLIKYTESIGRLAALFDIERLVHRYMIVVEPSWWGYQDASFFLLAGADADVIVEAQAKSDFDFLSANGFGLTPTRTGAGDWVDPAFFSPSGAEREYDVVMVSSWNPFKRHDDLFRALVKVRADTGRELRVALVGYPNGWTQQHIRDAIRRHDLTAQCEIFDTVPPAEVARIVGRARFYVLLSEREGANKAMYEAMFCDTPVLAPLNHRGINHDHLNSRTGMAFGEGGPGLAQALVSMVDRANEFSPRQWALENTGYAQATAQLDAMLAGLATARGGTWTVPIAAKKNQPNLRYALDEDRLRLNEACDDLAGYLRPVATNA